MTPITLPLAFQGVQGVDGDVQGVAVQGAKAFVEKQRVDRGFVADQVESAGPGRG